MTAALPSRARAPRARPPAARERRGGSGYQFAFALRNGVREGTESKVFVYSHKADDFSVEG